MSNVIKLILAIAFIVFIIAIGPIATIWAANTIIAPFTTAAIPYTIETWFAVVVLGAFFRAKVSIKKD